MAHRVSTARAAASIAAAVLVFGVGGCGSDETTVVTDDATVTVDEGSGTVEIETDEGSATITGETGGDLPEGWPEQIVLPEGGTITSAVAVTGDEAGWNVSSNYPDLDQKQLTDEVTKALEGAGFESQGSFTSTEGSVAGFEGNGYTVSVIVGTDDTAEGTGSTLIMTVAAM